jgi:hypothetical protein
MYTPRSGTFSNISQCVFIFVVKKVFKNIPQRKGPLESQGRKGWTILKMIRRKWVLEAKEKYLRIETTGNLS